MKLYQLSDEELAARAADHVLQYRGISESTRLLEELLKRFLQLQIKAEDE
tara:strand:- start:150 stop:299 length:150 start_codon:yes stop_codon:yes gene_type:complete